MVTHMKTTIDISDALFVSAKALAQQSQTTMRALIEEGLRRILRDANANTQASFKLKDARVHGHELLMPDPRDWQQFEENHVLELLAKPAP
jgi:thiamine monophosphate kinase